MVGRNRSQRQRTLEPRSNAGSRPTAVALGGFGFKGNADHATLANYPTEDSRAKLKDRLSPFKLGTLAADVWTKDHDWLEKGPEPYAQSMKQWGLFARDLGITAVRYDLKYNANIVTSSNRKELMNRAVALSKRLDEVANEIGVNFEAEFELAHPLVSDAAGVIEFGERIRTDRVGLMFDWCHGHSVAIRSGITILELIRRLAPFVTGEHVGDNLDGLMVVDKDFAHPATGRHETLGEGNVPLRDVAVAMQMIPAIAEKRVKILDLCFKKGDLLTYLTRSRLVMEELYGKIVPA